jgi:hypothetical protein
MRALIFALVLGASTATASARSTLLLGEATLGRELAPLTQFEASRENQPPPNSRLTCCARFVRSRSA